MRVLRGFVLFFLLGALINWAATQVGLPENRSVGVPAALLAIAGAVLLSNYRLSAPFEFIAGLFSAAPSQPVYETDDFTGGRWATLVEDASGGYTIRSSPHGVGEWVEGSHGRLLVSRNPSDRPYLRLRMAGGIYYPV